MYQQIEHEIQRLFRIAKFDGLTEYHRPQVGSRCPRIIDFECLDLVGNDDGAALALAVHLCTHADAAILAALHIDVAAVDLYAVASVAAVIAHTDAWEVPSAVGFHGAAIDGDGLATAVAAAADARTVRPAITHYQRVADGDVTTLAVVAGVDAGSKVPTGLSSLSLHDVSIVEVPQIRMAASIQRNLLIVLF